MGTRVTLRPRPSLTPHQGLGYFDFELPDKDRLVAEHKSVVSRPLQPASPPKPSSVPSVRVFTA